MIPDDLDMVTASYHRCMHSGGFVDTFYERFLASSPEVASKFRHTDFEHQKLMLRESLLMMIMFSQGLSHVREEIEQLAVRHDRDHVDIPPPMYDLWINALCHAVEQHDPKFTAEVEQDWRIAMQPGIDLMKSHY
ncbi:globin domain-containing protein [Novipirellula sp. SH528]|uniref:globin domain-containing protein n=1 Tax=Novipirellula sp. SH528 TaxID=3454466 RepID=UPI003FA09662